MARVTGLEPAASGVTGRRSNQLSYTRLTKRRPQRLGYSTPLCQTPYYIRVLSPVYGRQNLQPVAHGRFCDDIEGEGRLGL